MTRAVGPTASEEGAGSPRLAFVLAMAMFVLVVDTSLMNVSISAVVGDLDTTVSGVQSAIALEALVSAAFILISSKVGDLIGRKRAFVLGLLGYATGALAMTLAQGLGVVIVFWAIVGGLGASLLLPAMQSLIRGNFEGAAQKKAYALVGASAAVAAAVGPLLGGFVTTFLSWRVGFFLELVVIAVVLLNIKLVRDVPYTGSRQIDGTGAVLSVIGMGGVVLGILIWQEGGEFVGLTHRDRRARALGAGPLAGAASPRRKGDPARPGPLPPPQLQDRDLPAGAPEHHPGRGDDRAADLPPDLARIQRAGDRPDPRSALPDDVRGGGSRGAEGRGSPPRFDHPRRLRAQHPRHGIARPDRARGETPVGIWSSRWRWPGPGSGCWFPSSTTTRSPRSTRSGSARRPG